MNVYAAYFSQLKEANLGMVVKDHTGTILLCAMMRVGEVDSPLQAEFLAILFGLEECMSIVIHSVIIERFVTCN